MRRMIYLSVFVVLSGLAGVLYYSHTRLTSAVVATHDLPVGTRIKDADVSIRSVNPTSVMGQVLHSTDQAVGQVVSSAIFQDELIDARQLATVKNATLLASGISLPTGSRIIGLPITPSAAVGGVLKPGDLVDVLAIPNPSKAVSLTDEPAAPPTMLGKDVLVIGLRTDQGTPVDQGDRGLAMGTSKPSTVLLAIAPSDESTYSAAIAGSTFVLTLSTD
jgi:pilus assembly protein CpaB